METVKCSKCGHEMEIGEFPFCPHGSIFNVNAARFDPIVVHVDAQGNYRFPARGDAPVPEGFQKREITNMREAAGLEREINTREKARYEESQYRRREFFDQMQAASRSDLRLAMQRMSPYGRDFAQVAMDQADRRRATGSNFDPGFHIEVLHYNSSNRDAYRDAETGWRGRKG